MAKGKRQKANGRKFFLEETGCRVGVWPDLNRSACCKRQKAISNGKWQNGPTSFHLDLAKKNFRPFAFCLLPFAI